MIEFEREAWLYCIGHYGYSEVTLNDGCKLFIERWLTHIMKERQKSALNVVLESSSDQKDLIIKFANGTSERANKLIFALLDKLFELEEDVESDIGSNDSEETEKYSQELSPSSEAASPESVSSAGQELKFSRPTERLLKRLCRGRQEYINFWQELLTEVAINQFIDLSFVRVVSGNNHHVLISDAHDFVIKVYAATQMDIAGINSETQRSYDSCPKILAQDLGLICQKVLEKGLCVMRVSKLKSLPQDKSSSLIWEYTKNAQILVADPKPENFGISVDGKCLPLDWDYCFDKKKPATLNCHDFFNEAYYEREVKNFAHDVKMQEVLQTLRTIINPTVVSQDDRVGVRITPVSMFSNSFDGLRDNVFRPI